MKHLFVGIVAVSLLAGVGCKGGERKTGVDVPKYPELDFLRTGRKEFSCSNVFFQVYRSTADGRMVGEWYQETLEEDPEEEWIMPRRLPDPNDGFGIFRTENMKPGIDPGPVDCAEPARAVVISASKEGTMITLFENVPNKPEE